MSAAALASPRAASRDRLAAWCGWVMVGAAVLVPPIAWLSPLGFAPLAALIGLLCLPAIRMSDEDRPVLIVLLGALVWAAATTMWSPSKPADPGESVILQIALGLPLYWSAVCGARRADPGLARLALGILSWGLAAFGLMLLVDAFADAEIFRRLHEAYYEPLAPGFAKVKLAHGAFVLAVLWPAVLVGGLTRWRRLPLLALGVAGTVVVAFRFGADAPVLAFPLSALAMLGVWLWPGWGPRVLGLGVAAVSFAMPGVIWLVRAGGHYERLQQAAPPSWAARMSYWSHALDWILERPAQGWGLDAARAMGPGIALHPHNVPLQVWLELGMVGAVAFAVFWGLSLLRLDRARPDLAASGLAGSVVAYLLFSWINYGLWQQWWIGVGVLLAVVAGLLEAGRRNPSTGGAISE